MNIPYNNLDSIVSQVPEYLHGDTDLFAVSLSIHCSHVAVPVS